MQLLGPSESLDRSYNIVRLHLDDLEHIIALLQRAQLNPTLSDAEYEYDSLYELLEKRGPHPRSVYISGRTDGLMPMLTLKIDGYRARLSSDRASTLGTVLRELGDLLQSRESLVLTLLHPVVWGGFAVFTYFLQLSGWQLKTRSGEDITWVVPLANVLVATVSLASRKAFAGVVLKRRHEGGFLRRNADKLWLMIIGAVLAEVIRLIVRAIHG